MGKSRKEIEDIRFKLENTFEAYGKTVSDSLFETWLQTLGKFTGEEIIEALTGHLRGDNGNDSKYAPRPKHIADLAERSRERGRSMQRPSDEPKEKLADPKIAKAWLICGRRFHPTAWPSFIPDRNPNLKLEFDEALEIVNRSASRLGHPESIPDEYKLPQFWGQQDELAGF